jgi:hypothetical protein
MVNGSSCKAQHVTMVHLIRSDGKFYTEKSSIYLYVTFWGPKVIQGPLKDKSKSKNSPVYTFILSVKTITLDRSALLNPNLACFFHKIKAVIELAWIGPQNTQKVLNFNKF